VRQLRRVQARNEVEFKVAHYRISRVLDNRLEVRCNCTVARHENFEQSATRFGEMLQNAMVDKNMSIRDLATRVGSSYEYVRKLVRGLALPSRYLLGALAPILDLDFEAAQKLIASDKITQRFGMAPLAIDQNPELEPLQRGWCELTSDQKEALIMQFKTYIWQNKKRRKEAASVGG
jgi:transcriptional regulator with XRE-family HTH domain